MFKNSVYVVPFYKSGVLSLYKFSDQWYNETIAKYNVNYTILIILC